MQLGNISSNISIIAKEFATIMNEYDVQTETIRGDFEDIDVDIEINEADFLDDGAYNGTSNHKLPEPSLTLDEINKMSYEDVTKLLDSRNDYSNITNNLTKQKKLYNENYTKYEKTKKELKDLENKLAQLIDAISQDKQLLETNQRNLMDAQQLLKSSQIGYNAALADEQQEVESLQAEAYDKALELFNSQEAKEGEDGYRDFSDFYNEELGNISPSTSASNSAKSAMDNAAKKVNQYQTSSNAINANINALSTSYSSTNSTYTNKKTELNNISTNLQSIQTEIANLEVQMSNKKFVNDNKETIEKIKYNKDPAVIAAREARGVVYATNADGSKDTNAFDLTKMLSAEELALIESNNLDLTEKLADGTPRFMLARGNKDGKFHIYEVYGTNSWDLWAIARNYGAGGGYDIVPKKNGHLKVKGEYSNASAGGQEVYHFTEASDLSRVNFTNAFKSYKTSSPLSFDLNGDGVKTSNNVVNYDIDGDGQMDKINDSADGVLVFDKDGDGISGEDGSECFGDNTDLDGDGKKDGFKNGFEALKAFAKKLGLINGKDDNTLDEKDLGLLESNYGLKIKSNGYNSDASSLLDLGITQINLAQTDETSITDDFDGNLNQLMTQNGATFIQNGKERDYADIWHRKHA